MSNTNTNETMDKHEICVPVVKKLQLARKITVHVHVARLNLGNNKQT